MLEGPVGLLASEAGLLLVFLAGLVLARFRPLGLCVVCAGCLLLGESILLCDKFVNTTRVSK